MISVSVIVPVYNTEKYVGKTIESIMAQTYSNLEIILVDDGSPDSSGQICDEYARNDYRIKVVHQENAGQTAKIYLYGAGRIACEVATFLEENGVDYSVVVSETKGGEVFRGKPVLGFKDVPIVTNDVIILGLSEKNKKQVEALVTGYTVLDFGKYSYYY